MLLLVACVFASRYGKGDLISAYANVVGPIGNSVETFPYSSLPFCAGSSPVTKRQSLGDIFLGNHLQEVGIRFKFLEKRTSVELCTQKVGPYAAHLFKHAVGQNYWASFYVDDFPIWFPLGDSSLSSPVIYTFRHFAISYNGNRIVDVNVSCGSPVVIRAGADLAFTFSVSWTETSIPFESRFEKFRDPAFFEHVAHNYSMLNGGVMILLFTVVIVVLFGRILARDYNRFIQDAALDGFEVDAGSEIGWKALHNDVFRPPVRLAWWAMLGGSGLQFLFAAFVYAGLSHFRRSFARDSTFTYGLAAFVITAPIGGFFAVAIGRVFNFQKWLRLAFGTVFVIPILFSAVYIPISLFGGASGAARTFSLFGVLCLGGIELLIVLPLSLVGGFVAIKLKLFESSKCEVSLLPRHIPSYPCYLRQPVLGCAIGFVCFLSVIVELYFSLTSLWKYAGLYLWTYFAFALVSLSVVASCTTILAVFWLLQNEVHHWHWPAFISPASTALWVFAYSVYFFVQRTRIRGTYEVAYYFAHMGLFSLVVGLVAGGVGLFATNAFVHKIFKDSKLD
jgi:transmembrane 9 superfamily protein 3